MLIFHSILAFLLLAALPVYAQQVPAILPLDWSLEDVKIQKTDEWMRANRGNVQLVKAVELAFQGLSEVERGVAPDPCIGSAANRDINDSSIGTYKGSIPVSEISYEYAAELFQELANDPANPFRYPEDGCYARAHYMAMQLNARGITVGKAFLEGNLRVETKNAARGVVQWSYHVAPVLMIRRNGMVRPYVLDPSLFSEPVPAARWYQLQLDHPGSRVDARYFTPQYQYTPNRGSTNPPPTAYSEADTEDMIDVMTGYLEIQNKRSKTAKMSSK